MSLPPYVAGSRDDRWARGNLRGDLVAALRGALHRPDPTTSVSGDPTLPPAATNSYFGAQLEDDDAEELFLEAEEGEHPAEPTGDSDNESTPSYTPDDPPGPPPPVVLTGGTSERSLIWRSVKRELETKVYSMVIDRVLNFGTTTEIWQTLGSTATPSASGPAQGFAVNQRVGNRILLHRVHVRGYAYMYYNDPGTGLGTGDQLFRWGVALTQAPLQAGSSTAVSTTDFFDTAAGGVSNLLDDFTLWRKQQFCDLVDETFRVVDPDPNNVSSTTTDVSLVPFESDLTINKMIDFNASGLASTLAPLIYYSMRMSPSDQPSGVKIAVYHYFSDC